MFVCLFSNPTFISGYCYESETCATENKVTYMFGNSLVMSFLQFHILEVCFLFLDASSLFLNFFCHIIHLKGISLDRHCLSKY